MNEAQIKDQKGTLSHFGEVNNTSQTFRPGLIQTTWKKKLKSQSN